MKKLVFVVATALAVITLVTGQLSAQIPGLPNGCSNCGVVGWIDIPKEGTTPTVSATGFMIGGWGLECASGRATDRVDVYYSGDDGFDRPAKPTRFTDYTLPRPDVFRQFLPSCTQVTGTSGFQAYVTGVPVGDRTLRINIWREALFITQVRRVHVQ